MPGPDRIDRYEIEGVIGEGSMGVVYRARDPVIGRDLAIKTIRLGEAAVAGLKDDSGQRFARELRAGGVLSHPNIVTVYDAGNLEDHASAYMAMEFVEGVSLRDRIHSGDPMPSDEVLDLAIQVARALDYAHARGIIHRDVKPGNILLRHDGLVKLADFGIARFGPSDLTATGSSIGSPSYIAPEALDGKGEPRSDLFSLGVVLYEALTGKRPFEAETLSALYRRILETDPEPPSTRRPGLPQTWDRVILRMLEKRPGARYASAADLIEDLRRIERGQDPHAATPEPGSETILLGRADRGGRSWSIPPALLVAAFVVVLASVTALVVGRTGTAAEAPPSATGEGGAAEAGNPGGLPVQPAPSEAPVQAAIPAPEPPRRQASLSVRLTAPPATERFELLVDGEILLAETFDPEISSRRREPTTLTRTLEVPAGHHWFEARVSDRRGRLLTESAGRAVAADESVTLSVEMRGAIRRRIRLSWQ